MKAKAKTWIFEGGKNYSPGDVMELSEARIKALGPGLIETLVEVRDSSIPKPPATTEVKRKRGKQTNH
jgi:hypothetical protein